MSHVVSPAIQAPNTIWNGKLAENVPALLAAAAAARGDSIAIDVFERGQKLTYAELRDAVIRLSHGFHDRGIVHGTHVAVALPNRIEYPLTWLALAELGAVMIPLVTSSTAREIEFFMSDSDAEFLVTEPGYLDVRGLSTGTNGVPDASHLILTEADGTPAGASIADLIAGGSADFVPPRRPEPDDLLNIQYTSGTTGLPKGVMLSQRYWTIASARFCNFYGLHNATNLSTSPFFYIDGQSALVSTLYNGGRLDLAERPSIRKFVDQVSGRKTDVTWLVEQTLKDAPRPEEKEAGLKLLLAYHLSPAIIAEAEERYDAPVRELYGSTELGGVLGVPLHIDNPAIIGTCGVAFPNRTVRIVDETGADVVPGTPGELWVRGEGITLGYYKRPEANADYYADGWFRTGDLFVQNEFGHFSIVGRIKDMVRRSEENISAIEVEQVLIDMPNVANAAVVPVPDPEREEEVKVYIQTAKGKTPPTIAEVLDHCRARLAPFKVPRYIAYADSFPLTASDKVAKKQLTAGIEDLRIGAWDEVDQIQR